MHSPTTWILGISAYYHDSAACLLKNGEIVAAAQEERFTRKKHDSDFPSHAVQYCLDTTGIGPEQLAYVGFYDKPLLKFERLLETYLAYAPQGFSSFLKAMPHWLQKKLHLPRELRRGLKGYGRRFIFAKHHESHAASAFFPSPFQEAAILTLDGVGEWATATRGYGRDNQIVLTDELRFPHSLGLLYSAFTYFCGFTVNADEYKLMGLAPYGKPQYVDLILDRLIDLKDDGSFRMDMSYFNYCQGLTMTSEKFAQLFGGPPRKAGGPTTEREMDMAASVQKVTEEVVLRMARDLRSRTGMRNLCMAGGVALNCVANGRILQEKVFDNVWIQPAADDAGGALGVALLIWHQLLQNGRKSQIADQQKGSLLGPSYSDEEIGAFLKSKQATYEYVGDDEALCARVAGNIAAGKVVGWFQGRMEFGPRALGNRSILGDARNRDMQVLMNMKVKFRENFRPFAPVVLREHVQEYFDWPTEHESPYMLLVAPVRYEKRIALPPKSAAVEGLDKLKQCRSQIPAATHVDYSARVQTIDRERHGLFRKLMEEFYRQTECPVMVNTSFNLGWDPIVCSPSDAYDTFMSSDIDVLCMGHYVLTKVAQPVNVETSGEHGDNTLKDLLCSPCHQADLMFENGTVACTLCGQRFKNDEGICAMFWPHDEIVNAEDVTEKVKAFYEETPFPNYDEHDSLRSLIDKARRGVYAQTLDHSIPYNSTVLEVGCGTGQLSNFLGIGLRRVIGADLCLNSLRLGERFRHDNGLHRVRFIQMNLFRTCLKAGRFDVIVCNGVLHHTGNPFGGYQGLLPLLKPGGYIVIGLYNRYGRLMTDMRRQAFRMTGNRVKWIDPILRNGKQGAQHRAWFADQYCHPHESKHTIDEVLRWFEETGMEFVRGVPSVTPGPQDIQGKNLFSPEPRGTTLDHWLVERREIVTGNREGGFFIMIGRKPQSSGSTEYGPH